MWKESARRTAVAYGVVGHIVAPRVDEGGAGAKATADRGGGVAIICVRLERTIDEFPYDARERRGAHNELGARGWRSFRSECAGEARCSRAGRSGSGRSGAWRTARAAVEGRPRVA